MFSAEISKYILTTFSGAWLTIAWYKQDNIEEKFYKANVAKIFVLM